MLHSFKFIEVAIMALFAALTGRWATAVPAQTAPHGPAIVARTRSAVAGDTAQASSLHKQPPLNDSYVADSREDESRTIAGEQDETAPDRVSIVESVVCKVLALAMPMVAPPQKEQPPAAVGGDVTPAKDPVYPGGGGGGGGGENHPDVVPAPEPATVVMALTALGILGVVSRFRRRRIRAEI
jgi:hypothetical protein